jgi:hypothetical protein
VTFGSRVLREPLQKSPPVPLIGKAKTVKNRQNMPLDAILPVCQDAPIMSAGENQFSLIGAASITGAAPKSKFLSNC